MRGHVAKTVEQFCKKIHKRLLDDFKHALVWGTICKYIPQVFFFLVVLCVLHMCALLCERGGVTVSVTREIC